MSEDRRILFLFLFSWLWLGSIACGGGEAERDRTAEPAAADEAGPVVGVEGIDPCALVPLETWESATGGSGLELHRENATTCDVIDDANARIAGSIGLLSESLFDGMRDRFETEPIAGLGDEAYWVASGPGTVNVRSGDHALQILVNPHAVEDQRQVAEGLARTALQNL